MAARLSKEEYISDLFVKVELKLDSIINNCEDSEKTYEHAEWTNVRRATLLKFDRMVLTAESQDEPAKNQLIKDLKSVLLRVRFAAKLSEYGVFIVYDGPGKMFPIPGIIMRLIKGRAYQKL